MSEIDAMARVWKKTAQLRQEHDDCQDVKNGPLSITASTMLILAGAVLDRAKRIAELEAQLDPRALTIAHMQGWHDRDDEVAKLKAENAKLRAMLRQLDGAMDSTVCQLVEGVEFESLSIIARRVSRLLADNISEARALGKEVDGE